MSISKLHEILYWPICRMYARYIVKDNPADSIYRALCAYHYWRLHRTRPDFITPKRFSEKLWSRMLYDRSSISTIVNDKFQVRKYLEARGMGKYLIPLLWIGEDPHQIPFDELPEKFVIKTNHGCGYNIIVKDKIHFDREKTVRKLKKWLGENACLDKYLGTEWGYKNIKPYIIIESYIGVNGKVPLDYKFWCFSGTVEFITVHFDRFEKHTVRTFNGNFEPINIDKMVPVYSGDFHLPTNYREMIQVAESLSEEFAFIRVDLYNVNERIYFGEFSYYPGGVQMKFESREVDNELGKKWK